MSDLIADITDAELFDLIDWRPDPPARRSDIYVPAGASSQADVEDYPAREWVDWARRTILKPLTGTCEANICGLLAVAESVRDSGVVDETLKGSLACLMTIARWPSADRQAEQCVALARSRGLIRGEEVDAWHPGMASGSGWQTFYRLTVAGRHMALQGQPVPAIRAKKEKKAEDSPAIQKQLPGVGGWKGWQLPAVPKSQPGTAEWPDGQVEVLVAEHFRRNKPSYVKCMCAFRDGRKSEQDIYKEFGPTAIANAINEKAHPEKAGRRPCTRQNVEATRSYKKYVQKMLVLALDHEMWSLFDARMSDSDTADLEAFLDDGD
jgi:hypothetical protein